MTEENKQNETKGMAGTGFLGRGPGFWFITCVLSSALIFALALTGAIGDETPLLLLLIVPLASLVAMALAALNANAREAGDCVSKGAAQRRYIKRVAIFTSLYLASFAAMTLVDSNSSDLLLFRYVAAILPGLAIVGVFWAIARLIVEQSDEFIRMLTIRQTLIASAIAMSAASIWGFLEAADLVVHIDAYWYAVVWFGGLMVGALINRVQYGTWGAA